MRFQNRREWPVMGWMGMARGMARGREHAQDTIKDWNVVQPRKGTARAMAISLSPSAARKDETSGPVVMAYTVDRKPERADGRARSKRAAENNQQQPE